MMKVLVPVVLLAAFFQSAFAATTIACSASSIVVTSDDFTDQFVLILDQVCTPAQLTGAGTQTATLSDATCTVPGPDVSFIIAFTDDGTTISSAVLADAICTAQTGATVSIFPTATLSPPTSTLSDELTATITITPDASAPLLGSLLTVTISLDADSQDFYRMQVDSFTVTNGAQSLAIVTGGCPANSADSLYGLVLTETPSGNPATSVDVAFNVFIPINSNNLAASTVLTMTSDIVLCTSPFTACYDATGCPGSTKQVGRKRRQVDAANVKTVQTQLVVFSQEGSRDEFMTNVRGELGLTDATRIVSEEDLCVHKTTSVVVLVILIVGMVLCMLATCFMFMKLRKSRRLQDPDKSEYAYSNKSMKH